jgi:putative tryptophan/tyrosine transport system substrate-binding protein
MRQETEMRRRDVIAAIVAVVAWPSIACAQRSVAPLVGVIMGIAKTDPDSTERIAALKQRLHNLDWIDGSNLRLEVHWSAGDIAKAEAQAKELVAQKPDVLIAHTLVAAFALRKATAGIPIVFTNVSDANGAGLVQSVSHPGGNITGFSNLEPTIGAKWLQILHEMAPRIRRAAVIYNPATSPIAAPFATAATDAGRDFSVRVSPILVDRPDELEPAISSFASEADGALLFPPDIFTTAHRDIILPAAERYQLPAIYPYSYFVREGGLVSYGTNAVDSFAQAATYVDRILRGAKPADLPVQAPIKYEFVINLKAAKNLGLIIPPNVLDLADDLVQ